MPPRSGYAPGRERSFMPRNVRALAALACLLLAASAAEAGGCPTKPVAENGGEHWCYSASTGRVHLWKPKDFDADSAATVVYVHGYRLGTDSCPAKDYVDCAWDKHGLAAQFSASGLNALFVAIEAPTRYSQDPKWDSLGGLLRSIRRDGGIAPPGKVTAIVHSGGVYNILPFLDHARLRHVIVVDGLYGDSSRRLARWFKGSKRRRLTLIGADSRHTQTAALAKKLGCVSADDLTAPYSKAAKRARCASTVDAGVGHMDIVIDGHAIPRALTRVR
jgi:hypothetical protein